jgi:hypothetical protein
MPTLVTERPVEPAPAPTAPHQRDITAVPRAFLVLGTRFLDRLQRVLVDEEHISTASGNAWAAVCADRDRAAARADLHERLNHRR